MWFDTVYRILGGKGIHIVTADVPGAADHDRVHPNTVHRLRLVRHAWLKPESLAMYARLLARAVSVSQANRIDGVHAGRVLPEGLIGLIVARLRRVPLLIYAHGEEITAWRQPGKLRAMTYTFRHADRIVANSDFTRQELIKLGVAPDRITIIYPGVDVQRFRPDIETNDVRAQLGLGRDTKLVLSVGRLMERKGFDKVIEAIAALRAQDVDAAYAIIGIGYDRERLENVVARHGVRDRVHFLGEVDPADLAHWYNAADVFAMPNRNVGRDTEGFGMVYLEAAACGKPVIAGRDGGTGDAVIDGVTGLRVDGASTQAVTEALRLLLTDARRAHELGRNGLDRVNRELSWQRVAEKTRALVAPS